MKISSVRLGYWNVNRLQSQKKNKLKDNNFLKEIGQYDVIGLAETKHTGVPHILDYLCYPLSRSNTNNTVSGGLIILIKPLIRPGITFLKSTSEYQMMLLKKSFFNFEKYVYMCISCIPQKVRCME